MRPWFNVEVKPMAVAELGVRYRRYRLADVTAEETMTRSLSSYGQLAPVTACWRNSRAELLDGFKLLVTQLFVCGDLFIHELVGIRNGIFLRFLASEKQHERNS